MEVDPVIKVKGLKKVFKTEEGKETTVLQGIDLDIAPNDFCIIYGPSGSGKSTLLHHFIGLELPTEGQVIINGTDLTKMNEEERAVFRAKNFGMVYQFWYWAKSLNVLDNVALPLLIAGIEEKKARAEAMKRLEEIEMTKFAFKKPTSLSGGEQQKIGLARALVNDPAIIIADEPTGNLDAHSADTIISILQDLNVLKKRAIVMVTHNLVYLPIATKKVAVRDGQIISTEEGEIRSHVRSELKRVL
jgi:putative ABC transport system ATP-binding protein